jgi:glucan phosphoethanolaminetransferase (alkaline phosphatase superfamily)
MTTPYHFGTLGSQILLIILICSDFVTSFFFPFGLSTGYSYSPAELSSYRMVLAVIVALGLLILLVVSWTRRWRAICFGLLWFGICIAPFSHIIPYQIVRADHDMYHALIGLAIMTSGALIAALNLEKRSKGALAVIGALATALVILTLAQLQYYRTPYAYIQRFTDTQGWAPSVEILLARVHQFYGHFDAAERSLRKAIDKLNEPLRSGVRMSLADLYARRGRLDEALAQVELIPPDSPSFPQAEKALQAIRAAQSTRPGSSSPVHEAPK